MLAGLVNRFSGFIAGMAAMFSGAALIFTILMRQPLWLTLTVLGFFAASAFAVVWAFLPQERRAHFLVLIKVGFISGVVATILYDFSRWLLVTLTGWNFWPFKTFPIFGRLIAGEHLDLATAYAVGTVYHIVNGLLFCVAYCLIFGRRHIGWAVAWALVLESAVLLLYPGWLGLDKIMAEFTAVSIIGHVCFGLGLGFTSNKLLPVHRLHSG